ncbi:hypothetical protein ACWDT5_08205 [Rhodococcus aetherivorans]
MAKGVNTNASLGFSGPTVGVSKVFGGGMSDKDRAEILFAQIRAKAVFVDPVSQETPSLCVASVVEFKKDAAAILPGADDKALTKPVQKIIDACKIFLSAAGKDGVKYDERPDQFAFHLGLFRANVEACCNRLAFDYKLDLP